MDNNKKKTVRKLILNESSADNASVEKLFNMHYNYSVIGLVFSLIIILTGSSLITIGLLGHVSLNIQLNDIRLKLNTSIPGALLVIAGIIIVYITQFKVIIKPNK